MSVQDWMIIASFIVSLVSLGVVVYKEFLQGSSLNTTVDQLLVLRLPFHNKMDLLTDMILDDLLSDHPSRAAQNISGASNDIQRAIVSRNRDRLKAEVVEFSQQNRVDYNPPIPLVLQYIQDNRFSLSFCLPLVVYNSGKKFGHVSTLILVFQSKEDASKKWVFSPCFEMDLPKVTQRNQSLNDNDRISGVFTGFSVAPGETIKLSPMFTPMVQANNKIISKGNIAPGEYRVKILGFNGQGKKILESNTADFVFRSQYLIEIFAGIETIEHFYNEKSAEQASNYKL